MTLENPVMAPPEVTEDELLDNEAKDSDNIIESSTAPNIYTSIDDDVPLLQLTPRACRKICGIEVEFLNILLLGFGFMFSIGAYQTCAMAQVSTSIV